MKALVFASLCILLVSCDGGLAPPQTDVGFSGTIYFSGTWPSQDSIFTLLLFASKIYPLDSAKVVSGLFSSPVTIFLYPGLSQSLPTNVDSIQYAFPLHAGTFKYVGVIQQVDQDFMHRGIRAFRVVGYYRDSINISEPGIVRVDDGEMVSGINLNIDFQNIPIQPF